jgi:pimeloyl-ACP methyl ester carboxylesterase
MPTFTKIFEREELTVNGIKTVMLTAGKGEPLMFMHGGGTFHGFDFAAPWAEKYKVMIPYHPGFGESAEDLSVNSVHDMVLHYLEMFDILKLERVNLVGFSLGGYIASSFAVEHDTRLKKLVLVAPAGLKVPEAPTLDIFSVPGEVLGTYLVADMATLVPHLPTGHDIDFIVGGYREMTGAARILWDRNYDPKLGKWLHRIKVPTLLMWGEDDRIVPAAQAATWSKLIPNSTVKIYKGAAHLVLDEKPEAVKAVSDFFG